MNLLSLPKAVQLTANKLAAHIGSGDNAHLPVDRDHAGFMTPANLASLNEANGNLVVMPKGTDVMQLPAGNYQINQALNAPVADGAFVYEIKMGTVGIKTIHATQTATGRIYYRTLSDNNSTPSSWTRVYREVVLWSGNVTANDTVITLAASVYNFSKLKFYFSSHQGQFDVVEMVAPADAVSGDLLNLAPPTSDSMLSVMEMSLLRTDTTSYKTANNVHYVLANGGVLNKVADDLMSVIRIVGVI